MGAWPQWCRRILLLFFLFLFFVFFPGLNEGGRETVGNQVPVSVPGRWLMSRLSNETETESVNNLLLSATPLCLN